MVYKKELELKKRIKKLSELLMDSIKLNFNPLLTEKYNKQLTCLLRIEAKEKENKKLRRRNLKNGISKKSN